MTALSQTRTPTWPRGKPATICRRCKIADPSGRLLIDGQECPFCGRPTEETVVFNEDAELLRGLGGDVGRGT